MLLTNIVEIKLLDILIFYLDLFTEVKLVEF